MNNEKKEKQKLYELVERLHTVYQFRVFWPDFNQNRPCDPGHHRRGSDAVFSAGPVCCVGVLKNRRAEKYEKQTDCN